MSTVIRFCGLERKQIVLAMPNLAKKLTLTGPLFAEEGDMLMRFEDGEYKGPTPVIVVPKECVQVDEATLAELWQLLGARIICG
jgi:hypothetical protein